MQDSTKRHKSNENNTGKVTVIILDMLLRHKVEWWEGSVLMCVIRIGGQFNPQKWWWWYKEFLCIVETQYFFK
jgi:hypothetical protein